MSVTFAAADLGYHNLFNKALVRPERIASAQGDAKRVFALKDIFMQVQNLTGVPWQWVGAVLYRESDLNLKGAFANGDEIIGTGRKTKNVPANRGPFKTWIESAVDEIRRRGLDKIKLWSVERMMFEGEAFNGWGYLKYCNTPYVFSWTNLYGPPEASGGKYIRDHVFDRNTNDVQCGLLAIWIELAIIDADTAKLLNIREVKPEPGVIENAAKKATAGTRKVTAGAATVGTAGAASQAHKTTTGTQAPFMETPLAITLFGGGLIIAIVATMLTIKTGNLLKARW